MADQETKPPEIESLVSALKAQKERAIQALAARFDKVIEDIQKLTLDSPLEVNVSSAMRQSDAVEVISIQAGEFHNLSYTKAARAILEKIRKPLTTQEILAYFERSGRKVPGKNPSATIYSSLKKSSDNFELVSRNTWGLSEWYEKKRKIPQSVGEKTLEIMRSGAVSFVEAQNRARKELEKEAKQA